MALLNIGSWSFPAPDALNEILDMLAVALLSRRPGDLFPISVEYLPTVPVPAKIHHIATPEHLDTCAVECPVRVFVHIAEFHWGFLHVRGPKTGLKKQGHFP